MGSLWLLEMCVDLPIKPLLNYAPDGCNWEPGILSTELISNLNFTFLYKFIWFNCFILLVLMTKKINSLGLSLRTLTFYLLLWKLLTKDILSWNGTTLYLLDLSQLVLFSIPYSSNSPTMKWPYKKYIKLLLELKLWLLLYWTL